MKTILSYKLINSRQFFIIVAFSFLSNINGYAQNFKGRDGAETYSATGTYIPNRYTSLAGSVNTGSVSFTVSDINELSGSYSFTNSVNPYANNLLANGDLVMIIKMQGADITTTDDANYGAVTNYNNTGDYEVRTVFYVTGNTIYICEPLNNTYTQRGRSRIQVVRIPRITNLTIAAGASISGLEWNGNARGIVALETSGNILLNGTITANTLGFRGGADNKLASADHNLSTLFYRTTADNTSAGKGESIAGNSSDYNSSLNGANGRGAPANGGGGGNGHNSGGGGGANAGANGRLIPWNGTGIKNISTAAWANAWNLESVAFANDISVGGGRGGYSFANSDQNALAIPAGDALWVGNKRTNNGGFGGRPIDYNDNTRLFFGGGGGAGDGNNLAAGDGGNGGGIIYLLSGGNISGTGTITANGQDGYNTIGANIDAAGGAGGGGAIFATVAGTITGISMQANGGKGGDQLFLTSESEGPGGGGGGGYIVTTATSVSRQVNGGFNGITYSAQLTEFLPNGSTMGAAGTIVTKPFVDVFSCGANGFVLSVKMISFDALLQGATVNLKWITANEVNNSYFEIEKSANGRNFKSVGIEAAKTYTAAELIYTYTDNLSASEPDVIYYRLKITDNSNNYTYSDIRIVRRAKQTTNASLYIYPNPVVNNLSIVIPAAWQGKMVKYEVFDATGKLLILNAKNMAAQSEIINVENFQTGYYILKATMGAETVHQKIIKK